MLKAKLARSWLVAMSGKASAARAAEGDRPVFAYLASLPSAATQYGRAYRCFWLPIPGRFIHTILAKGRDNGYNLCFMVCWADCLGNCESKQSHEHVISANLWLSNTVMVQGFSWCADAPKEIAIANLTKKILCRKHNGDLSPVDASAGDSFNTLREVTRLKNVRERMKPIRWTVKAYILDGVMLERWLLKTLINIAFDGKYAIGADAAAAGRPSERLVRVAYGLEWFKGKAGLYTIGRIGMNIAMEDRVSFSPIMQRAPRREYVVGGIFLFRGFEFLLYLEPEGPQDLTGIYFRGQHLKGTGLMFQTLAANIRVGKHVRTP